MKRKFNIYGIFPNKFSELYHPTVQNSQVWTNRSEPSKKISCSAGPRRLCEASAFIAGVPIVCQIVARKAAHAVERDMKETTHEHVTYKNENDHSRMLGQDTNQTATSMTLWHHLRTWHERNHQRTCHNLKWTWERPPTNAMPRHERDLPRAWHEETTHKHMRVLRYFWWFICHLSSAVKSAAFKKSGYLQVPGSIPAENTSTQIHMDLSK